jgi:hypothetical protein
MCDYISSLRSEINPSDHYRKSIIPLLCKVSVFFKSKSFKEITREDFLSFLDSYRKTEIADPLHKWIGTYNIYRTHLLRFFKWLYYPDIEPNKRSKPAVIENIPQLKRKEKSIYKPTDLWNAEDDSLFLKYCPNPRDRLIEKRWIKINPMFDKLITSLKTAWEENGTLVKEVTAYNDVFDAFLLSLQNITLGK